MSATINLLIHRFLDCTDFPEGVNVKVKQKMTTMNLKKVTCGTCKRRIVASLQERPWSTLVDEEVAALEIIAAEADDKSKGTKR